MKPPLPVTSNDPGIRTPECSWRGIIVCALLAFQFAAYSYARTELPRGSCDSTIMFSSETMKLFVSLLMARKAADGAWTAAGWLKACIPALCFMAMNLLSMWSAKMVSTTAFVVVVQSKVLWTTFFSWLLLKRSLSANAASALVALSAGCATAALEEASGKRGEPTVGLALGMLALEAVLSGVSSVIVQKLFSGSLGQMWSRNVQLATLSAAWYACVSFYYGCTLRLETFEDFQLAALGALGGILVALSLTYAGAIEKTVATSAAVVLSAACQAVLSAQPPSAVQGLASVAVVNAVVQFSRG